MPTPYQTLLGQTKLDIGRAFGVGGDQWAGERTTGDGVDAPVTVVAAPQVTAYVRQVQAPVPTPSGPAYIGDTSYVMVAAAGTDIRRGDVRWSVADPSLRFQVLTIDTTRGVIEADLERTA